MTYDDVNFRSDESRPKETHPAGIVKAVCVDIIDLPNQKNDFYDPTKKGSKEYVNQVRLVWETAKRRSDGTPFTIKRTFSKSLYDGASGGNASALYKILSGWFGADFDGRFEARKIANRPALLVIRHEMKDGTVKAKLDNVLPDDDGMPYVPEGSYKRWMPKEDDGVPF